MLRKFFLFATLPLIAACSSAHNEKKITDTDSTAVAAVEAKIEAPSPAYLIIPGKSIGNTRLNENLDSVMDKLGRPDKSDAAMGSSFHTWFAKHDTADYQTDIFAHHNYDGKHDDISYVKVIRVTSPAFKTAENLHTGLAIQDIARHFKLNHVATYTRGADSLKVYYDRQAGISFEIDNTGKCTGITVHQAGDSTMTYLSLYPDRKRVDIKK
ncbi:hypothetical protein [Mucilaginibacter ginkgonis]|uniref:Lipoprotein n=1 Tax=Mucilaginibacter ginkgonis TaxID=2682091 RepID=A0A6I4INA6_9SPHI|nr:hypothetical protein [Mucilaginibacter ginkgonis]QQL49555.1 hypothetical protein GO620_015485 [Mucilaginibacter ginkgonis]